MEQAQIFRVFTNENTNIRVRAFFEPFGKRLVPSLLQTSLQQLKRRSSNLPTAVAVSHVGRVGLAAADAVPPVRAVTELRLAGREGDVIVLTRLLGIGQVV